MRKLAPDIRLQQLHCFAMCGSEFVSMSESVAGGPETAEVVWIDPQVVSF